MSSIFFMPVIYPGHISVTRQRRAFQYGLHVLEKEAVRDITGLFFSCGHLHRSGAKRRVWDRKRDREWCVIREKSE